MRMGILGLILLLAMSDARADWRGQNGAMWTGFTQPEQLAYIRGFLSAASSFDAHCRVNVLMKQAKEKLSAEQIVPLYTICKLPTQVGGTDERTVAQVTKFYVNPLNAPILISHVLDIIAMRSEGETAEKLEKLTNTYRMADGKDSH
jgi:hypothetical protein